MLALEIFLPPMHSTKTTDVPTTPSPIRHVENARHCIIVIEIVIAAQDRSPFYISYIMSEIWRHLELIDTFIVGNRYRSF